MKQSDFKSELITAPPPPAINDARPALGLSQSTVQSLQVPARPETAHSSDTHHQAVSALH